MNQLDPSSLLLIDKKEGFDQTFSHLVSMMNYTRETTLRAVEGLGVNELDYLLHEEANTIGMLLGHLSAVERVYQIITFENRMPTKEEEEDLAPGLDLGEKGRKQFKGKTLETYLEDMESVRKKTFETFKELPDSWLFEKTPFWWDLQANNYFKWFHVFEDELSHRGQIRLLKKCAIRK